jgi:DNA-binding IclR family transcriptional regulator
VLRACDVLDRLAAHPDESFSVSELARAVDAPRATCDSVLLALSERGLVQRNPDRSYSLGFACRALGAAAERSGATLSAIEPIADELARATASFVAISTRARGATRVERVFDRAPAIAVRARLGESVPLVPPFGAVFVAWNDAETDEWIERARPTLDAVEQAHVRAALVSVRSRGYTISSDVVQRELAQLLEDLADGTADRSVLARRDRLMRDVAPSRYLLVDVEAGQPHRINRLSAPVFDAAGTVAYALMVLGPTYDLWPDEIAALGERLVAAAHSATARIGGRQP